MSLTANIKLTNIGLAISLFPGGAATYSFAVQACE